MAMYKYGSSGDGVKDLQNKLNERGGYSLEPDGIYGKQTQSAVEDYQRKNNLTVDGIAGPQTQGHLNGSNSGITENNKTAQVKPNSNTVNNQPNVQQNANNKISLLQKGYSDPSEATIDALYDKVINQKEFDYDVFGDPTYNQYAENYKRNAALMSEDALAQAAALTGGYGSSYAQALGTQAYNQQMTQLNNIVPELRQNAYNEWQNERARALEDLQLILNERDYDRSIFENDRAFEESQRQYDSNLAEEKRQFNAGLALDRENMDFQRQQYNDERDALAMEAGFSSWEEYANAVNKGQYVPTGKETEIQSFSKSFLDGAIKAFQDKGENGLIAYFDVYGDEYSEEQLSILGDEIVSGYALDDSNLLGRFKSALFKASQK